MHETAEGAAVVAREPAAATTGRRRPRAPLRAPLRVEQQAAYVLHTWPWRETSLIVDAITPLHGRVALVARGAKRPTSHFRGLLAPFAPLALSWSGRGEVRTLTRIEWLGGHARLRGDGLLAAFYLNELLVRLLARDDPHPALFGAYSGALRELATAARAEAALRGFELDLLREIGYAPSFEQCGDGLPIEAGAWYRVDPGLGVQRIAAAAEEGVRGATLQALVRRDFADAAIALEARRLLGRLIGYHLDGKPLNTRRILRDLRQL